MVGVEVGGAGAGGLVHLVPGSARASSIVQTIGITRIIIVTIITTITFTIIVKTLAWWPAHAMMGRFLILWHLLPQVLELWEICKKSQNHQKIFERQKWQIKNDQDLSPSALKASVRWANDC